MPKRRVLCLKSDNPDINRFDKAATHFGCEDCGGVHFVVFFHGGATEFNCTTCHSEAVFMHSVAVKMFDTFAKVDDPPNSNGSNGASHV
mgnify:CR=1 FL=1